MKDCFILATGNSMLSLTDREKEYIRSCKTISVNRYPCFYDKIGIIPDSNIYVDVDQKTESILRESSRKMGRFKMDYYTKPEHIDFLTKNCKNNWRLIPLKNYNQGKFSETIDGSLFWCSIVGMAINLSYILYPDSNIKVVGMDGGLMTHFWCKDMIAKPQNYTLDSQQNLDHSEKNNHHACEWWPRIYQTVNNFFENKPIKVFNCNQESWFVKNRYMQFGEVLKNYENSK